MSAIENFFVGKKYNSEEKGESLESYLNFLNSEKNGTSLSESITDQFKVAKETIDKLNNDFASQVNEDNNKMLVAYDEIQKGVSLNFVISSLRAVKFVLKFSYKGMIMLFAQFVKRAFLSKVWDSELSDDELSSEVVSSSEDEELPSVVAESVVSDSEVSDIVGVTSTSFV